MIAYDKLPKPSNGNGTSATRDAPGPAKARKGSALPSPAPSAGAPPDQLLKWLTAALRLPAEIQHIERWGTTSVAPVALKLADGRKIRFAEAADVNNPARLVQQVVLALGTAAPQLPMFTRADAQDVFSVTVRACAAVEHDDDVADARDWQDGMQRVVTALHHGDYSDPAARWAGLRWLYGQPHFDAARHRLAEQDGRYGIPALVWADGSSYLRVEDVVAYVRGVLGERLAPQQVVARMKEAGWGWARAEARRPGAGHGRDTDDRVRVSVFIVHEPSGNATQTDVSPSSPNTSHAHARTHASTASGRLGTTPEPPMNTEGREPGDTKEPGDTSASLDDLGPERPGDDTRARAAAATACRCERPLPAPDEDGDLRCAACGRPCATWAAPA